MSSFSLTEWHSAARHWLGAKIQTSSPFPHWQIFGTLISRLFVFRKWKPLLEERPKAHQKIQIFKAPQLKLWGKNSHCYISALMDKDALLRPNPPNGQVFRLRRLDGAIDAPRIHPNQLPTLPPLGPLLSAKHPSCFCEKRTLDQGVC